MMRCCFVVVVALALLVSRGDVAVAGSKETATVEAACDVMDALADLPMRGIPPALMHDAQGIAIIPGVIKASFMVGGRFGRGVLLVREQEDSWSKPVFITIGGGSIGWQIGVQSTDLVLVFKTRQSVDRILKGKTKLTLGGDLAVAAGPLGRQAEAATDAQLKAEIYSYSRTRGLFAGLSLEGAALLYDAAATDAFYRPVSSPLDNLRGKSIPLTPPEEKLRLRLGTMSAGWAAPPPSDQAPIPTTPASGVPASRSGPE